MCFIAIASILVNDDPEIKNCIVLVSSDDYAVLCSNLHAYKIVYGLLRIYKEI